MRKFRLTLLFIALLGAFSACNKDDDAAPATKGDLLVAPQSWVFTGYTVNPGLQLQNGSIATDLYPIINSVFKDDIIKFRKNPDTYTMEEGATKGPAASQIKDAGSWYLSSDESAIILTSTTVGQYSYDIVELSATTLKFTYSQQDSSSGTVYLFTETYTAQ